MDVEAGIFDRLDETQRISLLRTFYGTDWADRPSRRVSILDLRRAAAPGFNWRFAARLPPIEVPLELAELIGETIERDFSTYRQRPTEASQSELGDAPDTVIVKGWVLARSRSSREALRRYFEDPGPSRTASPAMLESQ